MCFDFIRLEETKTEDSMKSLKISLSIFILCLISTVTFPQNAFEGKVEYKMTNDDETTSMTYFVKDENIKIDVAGEEKASMIFNIKDNTMLMIMPEEKMYMEMKFDAAADKMDEMKEKENNYKKTGEKKEILGYTCEKWIFKDDDGEVETWLTKELGSFMFFSDPMGGEKTKPEWQSKLESAGYFPMEFTTRDDSGDIETHMEVTSVEKKSLSSDMFKPPAGYQKFEMPGF